MSEIISKIYGFLIIPGEKKLIYSNLFEKSNIRDEIR